MVGDKAGVPCSIKHIQSSQLWTRLKMHWKPSQCYYPWTLKRKQERYLLTWITFKFSNHDSNSQGLQTCNYRLLRALKDQLNKWNRQEEYTLTFSPCFELARLHNWLQKDTNNCLVLWQHTIKSLIRMSNHPKLKCNISGRSRMLLRNKNLIFPPNILLDRYESINPFSQKAIDSFTISESMQR